jgi:hypothetical protein
MEVTKSHGIRVGFDEQFLDKWLARQKYAWMLITITLVAGLAGLLGRGPLSKHTVGSEAEGMEIKYERIARNKTPASIEIKLFASPSAERPLRLRIEGDLLRIGRLRQIVPEPSHSYLMRNGFIAEYPAGVSNGLISISQEPGAPGRLWNRVSVEGGSTLEFVQLVLP